MSATGKKSGVEIRTRSRDTIARMSEIVEVHTTERRKVMMLFSTSFCPFYFLSLEDTLHQGVRSGVVF
jgi:hypothetical protein